MSDEPRRPVERLDYQAASEARRRAVLVGRFATEIQARFVAMVLERAGIVCFLLNTNANVVTSVGGMVPVEIMVRPEDQQQAEAIMRDIAEGRVPVPEWETGADEDDDEEEEDPRCPRCRSWQVREFTSFREDVLRFFRLLPAVQAGVKQMECLRCGNRWEEVKSS